MDINQLVTLCEAAALKGVRSNVLSYHLKAADAPKPILVGQGKHKFYDRRDILAWKPNFQSQKGSKLKHKED